jgi:hypothetical protein
LTFESYLGYDLLFIRKEPSKDKSAHEFTYVYKFHSPITGYHYVLRAEYHAEEVFAVKFYCKKDRRSDYKYSRLTNKGDVGNILKTCVKLVPLLLDIHPKASFGFVDSRTLDRPSRKVENYNNNQRFRIYKYIAGATLGTQTSEHIEYPEISGYLLINRRCGSNIADKERAINQMFLRTYNNLPDI